MNTSKFQILKQECNEMTTLTTGLTRFITNQTIPVQIPPEHYSQGGYNSTNYNISQFLLKLLRFNYQLLREQQDQDAYFNFPQVLTEIELLPLIFDIRDRYSHYRDRTSFNTNYSGLINSDNNFILEHSETSDSRPYVTSNVILNLR